MKKEVNDDWNYKLWTRTDWTQYDREYNRIASGVHGLGVVPIVCVYAKKSKISINYLGSSVSNYIN